MWCYAGTSGNVLLLFFTVNNLLNDSLFYFLKPYILQNFTVKLLVMLNHLTYFFSHWGTIGQPCFTVVFLHCFPVKIRNVLMLYWI